MSTLKVSTLLLSSLSKFDSFTLLKFSQRLLFTSFFGV